MQDKSLGSLFKDYIHILSLVAFLKVLLMFVREQEKLHMVS